VAKKAKRKKQARKQQLEEQLLAEQQRAAVSLESLSAAVGHLQPSSSERVLDEIRKLLDDVLVAQHRTNRLLELALRAGFDDEERTRELGF
jgi:hypothetical protein